MIRYTQLALVFRGDREVAFRDTRYLGGNRYESTCIRCGAKFRWSDEDHAHMVLYPNFDIGMLCQACYDVTLKPKARVPTPRQQ